MNGQEFALLMLEWYAGNKRNLPWRKTKDPYKIWLSEILLQQTRVAQGTPYYLRFVKKYPTIKKLAQAPESEVLRLWQGLGYYSRARNLHKCANIISNEFRGLFPQTFDELKTLPGIGDYTAAAIASLGFNQPSAVVDGNVFRVLSRLFAIDINIASPAGKKYFFSLANTLIPKESPGEFNQAMMEFGAVHCTPRNPKCDACMFSKPCLANQKGIQSMLPVKTKPKKKKVRYFNYFVIRSGNKIWMKLRSESDIWKGLHGFYLIETKKPVSKTNIWHQFEEETGLSITPAKPSIRLEQILSHQKIVGKFFEIGIDKMSRLKAGGGKFCTINEIEALAKPVLITNYFKVKLEINEPVSLL